MLNIAIIGMGLIGASLGMALRSAKDEEAPLGPITIVGYDRNGRATSDARGRLAIDRQARTLDEALRDAQLVVVAVPAQEVREIFTQIAPLLAHGTIVTDVTSTKAQVIEWARELLPRTIEFIGGHPMAGKEQSGVAAADRELFKGSIYCLTPLPSTRQEAIAILDAMVQQVGAKSYYVDAAEHDAFVGGVSHLPFMLSAGLVEVTSNSPGWREMSPLAATGYRDISRLASGDAKMHRDICLTNSDAMIRWIEETIGWLYDMRELIQRQDGDKLLAMFEHARQAREQWLGSRPNLRPGEDDFQNLGTAMPERPGLFGQGPRRSRDQK
jgi:prephenate dehydrogenase